MRAVQQSPLTDEDLIHLCAALTTLITLAEDAREDHIRAAEMASTLRAIRRKLTTELDARRRVNRAAPFN